MRKLLNLFKYLLLLAVSGFMMWYALRGINFGLVLEQLGHANYFWLAATVVLTVASYVSRAHRWRMQLSPLGYHIGLRAMTSALMIGYLANLVLPRVGEVVRCSMLRRNNGIPVQTSFGTVITERVIDLAVLLSLLGLTLVVEFERLSGFFIGLVSERYAALTADMEQAYLVGVIILVLAAAGVTLVFVYLHKLRQHVYFAKFTGLMKGLWAGVLSIRQLENKGAFIFYTVFIWGSYFVTTWLALFTLPATSGLGPAAGLAIMTIGGLGMAAPVQGGIGVFHLMVSSTLLLYGLTLEEGMAYALILHTSQTLLVVLMGGISFLVSVTRPPWQEEPAPALEKAHDFT